VIEQLTVSIGLDTVELLQHVARDLDVHLDDELSVKEHVNQVSRTCFHLLRRLRQVHRQLGQDFTVRLVVTLILSRLDYCTSLFAGLPASTIAPLPGVQNAAARLVFGRGSRDHITPAMIQLHWLPVYQCVTYKLCVLICTVRSEAFYHLTWQATLTTVAIRHQGLVFDLLTPPSMFYRGSAQSSAQGHSRALEGSTKFHSLGTEH
jgi:hypothetical protein